MWKPYVPAARRRALAEQKMAKLKSKGLDLQPIAISGRTITQSFWGKAWCEHLESFSDYANRLPRGRTYVRNGSVCHLATKKGIIEARVSGSELYQVKVTIKTLPAAKWKQLKKTCAGRIDTLLGLLGGNLSDDVMKAVTDRRQGLFPGPNEIAMTCDCPDWADMCKHIAAVMYGVGARLDERPDALFQLRGVKHEDLIDSNTSLDVSHLETGNTAQKLEADNLSEIFGIDIIPEETKERSPAKKKSAPKRKKKTVSAKKKSSKTTKVKTVAKKKAKKRVSKKKTSD